MTTYSEVVDAFDRAEIYATQHTASLTAFTNALQANLYQAPTYSFSWNSLAAPALPAMPAAPTMPTIDFQMPTGEPGQFTEAAPSFGISSFTEVAPTLNLPTAPTLSYGATPSIPTVAAVSVPNAPTVTMPDLPTYLTLTPVTFGGVDLREDWLLKLETMPELQIVQPTPFSYALGPKYASGLLTDLQAKIQARLAGGTGLPSAVEQAIWDRARARETSVAQANVDEVMRAGDALGYQLPAGALAAQLRSAQQDYYDKLSGLSRDVAIKQAELEQENLKQTIDEGMRLESTLIDYSVKIEQLSFDIARAYADNAVQLYNASLDEFKTLLAGYESYASVYKTIIDSQLAKVEVFKAQLAGEQAKADVNKSLVEQYKASIEAGMAQVEIYRAQVGAAQTLVQLEQTKIGAAGEQIRAYVAQINGETAKLEAYKTAVQAESVKVDVYKTKADVYSAKASAEAEYSRALISRYTALAQSHGAQWEAYRAKVQTESARIEALGKQSGAMLDAYTATTASVKAQGEMQSTLFEAQIKQYEASQQATLAAQRLNHDSFLQANNAKLDAAKVGAQVYAQLTASAYSMVNASASISDSNSLSNSTSRGLSISYSYGGDVNADVTPRTDPMHT